MKLDAGCEMVLETTTETAAVVMLMPQTGEAQTVLRSEIEVTPAGPHHDYRDAFGNLCRRLVFPAGRSTLRATCTAEVPDEIDVNPQAGFTLAQDLPDDVLQYLLPSRFVESDLLVKKAHKVVKPGFFNKIEPGYQQAEAIRDWIFRKLKYKYGASGPTTSAVDTAKKREGVCRDFTHLGIALCRALRIPARMVVGYLHTLDPMDLHAWFEAFVGGRWYTFDATQKVAKGNRIVIAYGRDAADVAQITEFGPMQTVSMNVWVTPAATPQS